MREVYEIYEEACGVLGITPLYEIDWPNSKATAEMAKIAFRARNDSFCYQKTLILLRFKVANLAVFFD